MNGKRKPARNPRDRENQMISLAVDCAEERIRSGKASDTLLCHYLKLGTTRYSLEKEKLEKENELLRAKTDAIERDKNRDELYNKVISMFKQYRGEPEDYEDEEFD